MIGIIGVLGVVPLSFGTEVLETLQVAFSSRRGVLELLLAVVAVILSQRHFLCLLQFTGRCRLLTNCLAFSSVTNPGMVDLLTQDAVGAAFPRLVRCYFVFVSSLVLTFQRPIKNFPPVSVGNKGNSRTIF